MKKFTLRTMNDARNAVSAISAALRDTKKLYQVVLKLAESERSRAQNNVMWMWYDDISKQQMTEYGDYRNAEWWHYRKRCDFGRVIGTMQWNGVDVPIAQSSTEWNMGDFSDYLKELEAWAMSKSIQLRFPDDYRLAVYGGGVADRVCFDTLPRRDVTTMGGEVRV